MFPAVFLVLAFLATWGVHKGGFPFFLIFLMIMFFCMARKAAHHGGQHGGYGPQHNPWQGPGHQKPGGTEDARPYQAQPGAPADSYGGHGDYGSYGSEGTPTVRTDVNTGAGTVRVDNAPGPGGQPTTPLREQPRPEEPRARVEQDRQ